MSYIPYGKHTIDEDDIRAVVDVLRSQSITQGPKIKEFEEALAGHVKSRFAVAVSSGTAALHCACYAAEVKAGDEIITSPITFAASGNCGLFLGAQVKFVDITPDTYCMDVAQLERAITPKTRVIVPVDFSGQPCDMDEIMRIAKKYNITVIHDAAHSLGATYKGRPVGSLADMTIFSFHPVKHISCGEGGMVTTDDPDLDKQLKLFRTHGITNKDEDMELIQQAADNENQFNLEGNGNSKSAWYYEMQAIGYNYRITDIQCALGISQLKKLDRFLERRREIVRAYNEAFAQNPYLITPFEHKDRQSAWHLYMLRFKLDQLSGTRRKLFDALRAMKIGVHVHYIPVHLQPVYRRLFGYKRGDFPVSERYYDSAMTIPLYPSMTDDDVQRVICSVLSVVNDNALTEAAS